MQIATRILKLRQGKGELDISIRIFAPEAASATTWFCQYQIDWPEGARTSRAGGVDSMQALYVAMQMIGSEIYTSSYHKAGKLRLDKLGDGYGFPVPTTLRDRLVGQDKKFF